jgi:DNA helicase HerA-like ATPase
MPAPLTRPEDRPADSNGLEAPAISTPPEDLLQKVQADSDLAGGALPVDQDRAGAVGATMFDLPGSEDDSVTVLLPRDHAQAAPSQALVRIKSSDGRTYLGIVTAGPFAEPDTLRADSHLLVTVTARGGIYLPPYHGRVQVAILGEELADGTLSPPRWRPLPNSPVIPLSDAESAEVLRTTGDLRLGLVAGHEGVVVGVPSDRKAVLPRHLAVLGTTGSGKSTTVARLVQQAQAAGLAVILLDVEGEYTQLHEPADDDALCLALKERGLEPAGIAAERMMLYHFAGRDTTNPEHPNRRGFSLQLARLSPYTVMEMLGLNDAQTDRFLFAYDLAKVLLRDLGIFPQKNASPEEQQRQEQLLLRLDDQQRGYPRLTLSLLLDVLGACRAKVTKSAFVPFNAELRRPEAEAVFERSLKPKQMPDSASSWGKLYSLLWRLRRLRVFYGPGVAARPLSYADLLRPGQVSVIDLSDAGLSELSNIAVADVLHGVQEAQEKACRDFEAGRSAAPPRVLIVIEEAHEFLSAERVEKTPHLFGQIARLAKRGRKRWLSLAFVTQLPQHLPRQVLSLCNNFILHKLTDPHVVSALRHTISGIDESLWARLPGLAPGQALVSFGHMTRPLLVAVDPAPCKLRMVD